MISFDTNILFSALEATAGKHQRAREVLESYREDDQVVLCELMLLELYALLRNPATTRNPLAAKEAVNVIQAFRHHPAWRVIDYDPKLADPLWSVASQDGFAFRRVFDARLALTLRHHGVTEFATRNAKDFQGFGFKKVWDPLA